MSASTSGKPDSKRDETKTTNRVNDTNKDASLLHRLAGPSSMKAGLALDQLEINKRIAEASKGSKYYENERRKDEELASKINALLKQRDELMAMADIPRLEAVADKVIAELEATRDLSQYIVHIDMDSFYASVEMLDNPSLVGKAFGVGSLGGVLSTASYEARKLGVRSGMAGHIAKKLAPDLIFVTNHFSRYSEVSGQVMTILRRYDETMNPVGVDEAYLNITDYCEANKITPEECTENIRKAIFQETKLTASAGIAPNKRKMLAKICSERNKPNGLFKLEFDAQAIRDFMKGLPIRRIPGVGRVTERLLESVGIKTCEDIYTQRATLVLMDKHFHMHDKLEIYLGLGSNVVRPWPREARKSVGSERDPARINEKLEQVAKELEEDMERLGYSGHTVTLKLKLDTFEGNRAKSVHRPIRKYNELLSVGQELLAHELPLKLRLLGLRVTNLKDLRAQESGIKRFFGQTDDPNTRPLKRRKISNDKEVNTTVVGSILISDDEDDVDAGTSRKDLKRAATATPERPRSQILPDADVAPRASSHEPMPSQDTSPLPSKRAKTRPDHSSTSRKKPDELRSEQHICPICSKTLQTDNTGLNEHIDWCLSRSAILEASASETLNAGHGKPVSTQNKAISKAGGSKPKPKATQHSKPDIRLAWKQL
ncbi:DNA polymerase IV {ECO:0000255/HAMAP-Rule:MF_01113} Short=Pol IV {ECO:0000255/HAMAP-Rule:MF_01113}; {ECO:0000255/HAMAP-Rule:MF_01113} [Serendipita indica DSM 11827]|nr:DNA polymerase IV {ECO:0000255/HAMAP-Rule:MF_01113} Short=Pol IV {ECO:0000255/HAMAP-Rule:MF_01113}; {ECO:0000255/HAMAP-Rule:MF_01113} [Serendipita indica DSM 11827]